MISLHLGEQRLCRVEGSQEAFPGRSPRENIVVTLHLDVCDSLTYRMWKARERKVKDGTKVFVLSRRKDETIY